MSTIAITNGVTGNVGSCKIESSSRPTSSWRTETISINSCTGEIVGKNEYFDGSNILLVMIVSGCFLVLIALSLFITKLIFE